MIAGLASVCKDRKLIMLMAYALKKPSGAARSLHELQPTFKMDGELRYRQAPVMQGLSPLFANVLIGKIDQL